MVRSIAWSSPDHLLSADRDGWVKQWLAPDMSEISAVRLHQAAIRAMEFSRSGEFLATASRDGTATIWTRQLSPVREFTAAGVGARIVRWSCSDLLAVAWWNGIVEVYRTDGTLVGRLTGSGDWVRSIAWSANDAVIVGSQDGYVVVWDPAADPRVDLKEGREAGVRFVLEEGALAIECTSGQILPFLAYGAAGEESAVTGVSYADAGHMRAFTSIALNDGTQLNASAVDSEITVSVSGTDGPPPRHLTDHRDWVRTLRFSQDGSLLASAGDDNVVMTWDPADGRRIRTSVGHKRGVRSLAWGSSNGLLASGGADGMVILWDATGQPAWAFDTHGGEVVALAWHRGASVVACGTAAGWLYLLSANGEVIGGARLASRINDIVIDEKGGVICATEVGVGVRFDCPILRA
jgi:WD40 repeat protein